MPFQRSGEPPILPLRPPVPINTYQSCLSLLPNPAEPHDASNLVSKYLPDQVPIYNNRRIPSNYPHTCCLIVKVAVVSTHGTNSYNTQL